MKRFCLALDLIDDPELIAEHEYWHKAENGWPEIKKVLRRPALQTCSSTERVTVYS